MLNLFKVMVNHRAILLFKSDDNLPIERKNRENYMNHRGSKFKISKHLSRKALKCKFKSLFTNILLTM